MSQLQHLFENNLQWSESVKAKDATFFEKSAAEHKPDHLWIGCADSRVPANEIVGLKPGELFVHRNIANTVCHTDLNCLSVIQYAVDVLKVKHIIVCGHYSCGGINAACGTGEHGLIDNWLRNIKDVYSKNISQLEGLNGQEKADRLSELNVVEQVSHVCQTTVLQNAWRRGQAVEIHGWIYNLADGLLKDLNVSASGPEALEAPYRLGE